MKRASLRIICDHYYFIFQRGIVHVDENHYYLIHPLPKIFHNETSTPHILIRKNHKRNEINPTSICSHDYNFESDSFESTTTEYNKTQPRPADNTTKDFTKANYKDSRSLKRRKRETFPDGAPAFVETAVFVDKDLFDHMKTNYPVDTERELIRFVLAMINAVSIINIIIDKGLKVIRRTF